MPAGGFAHNVDISIRRLEPKLVPLQPEGSIRVGATYQIEATAAGAAASAGAPAELTPLRPLSLQLPYDPAGVPAVATDSPVAVFWDGEGWVEVATTMAGAAGMVMATPSHLSIWTVEARSSRVAATVEINDIDALSAGEPIVLRVSASNLEGGATPATELTVAARYKDEVSGTTQVVTGSLPLVEAAAESNRGLDLFAAPGTLGQLLVSVRERDRQAGDGLFDLVVDSDQVHEQVQSLAFSARVGSGLSKVETEPANMIFPLPPPIADLAIIDFALQDVDSQPLDPAGLEQGQEVLLAVFYTNAGGLPVFDARIELRVGDRLAQEADLSIPVGARRVHNFRLRLRAGEQSFTALVRSVGQVADATPTDNQMSMTLAAIAAVHQLRGRVVDDVGLALSTALLTLSGGGSLQVVTDAQGRFLFADLGNADYTLFTQHPDFQFPSIPVAVNGADVDLAIVARPLRFAISGHVSDPAGVAVADLAVRLSGDAVAETMTDRAGHYRFAPLPIGNYEVQPLQKGVTVTPPPAKLFLADNFGDIDFVVERQGAPMGDSVGDAEEPEPTGPSAPDDPVEAPAGPPDDLPGGATM